MNPIDCQGLSKRFGNTVALDNITLSLPAGEPIALIGHNGAGKTTLLSVLCGFIKPTNGKVSVFGEPPGSSELSGRLAALPQDTLLDPRVGVGRQLRLFAKLQGMSRVRARDEVERVLHLVDLLGSINTKPSNLSHGMRKRIAIAQALLGSPKLVLLDEPTAGIDPPNAKMIRTIIREQSARTTFLISSHNLDELEWLCGCVVYLEKGKLVSVGPVVDNTKDEFLTVRMMSVDESEFLQAVRSLPDVSAVIPSAQGDFLVQVTNDMRASAGLMQLFADKGWRYRHVSRGKTLEERLYGDHS